MLRNQGPPCSRIDLNRDRLEKIGRGEAPFFEPKSTKYVKVSVASGKLTVTDDASANGQSNLAYITVGTPSNEDGSLDVKYVRNAAIAIGRSLRDPERYQLIAVKSTVTPGTARNVVKPLIERESGKTAGAGFGLCCPTY